VADTKISALTGVTVTALANEFAVNEAGTSKKATLQQVLDGVSLLANAAALADANTILVVQSSVAKDALLTDLVTYLQTKGMPRVFKCTSDHAISSVTGTEVTQLGPVTLEAGTYTFEYYLLLQSATLTVSPLVGINFTGTAAVKNFWFQYADLSSTLLAAIGTMSELGTTAVGFGMASAQNAYSTTSPNMGNSSGATNRVKTINTTFMAKITGSVIVTASGDLELWHSSQTTTSTTVMTGTSLVVTRVA